jgi:hypothetical protein
VYWERPAKDSQRVAGIQDLDGDKFQELVVHSENHVSVLKADAKEMWRSRPFTRIETVQVAPTGEILVQADGDVVELDARGNETARRAAPSDRDLSGRANIDGKTLDLFEAKFDDAPRLGHDLDADGKDEVVVVSDTGLIAYDAAGNPVLELRTNETEMKAALGDLDGKPGHELALAVRHYGIIVLGRRPAT